MAYNDEQLVKMLQGRCRDLRDKAMVLIYKDNYKYLENFLKSRMNKSKCWEDLIHDTYVIVIYNITNGKFKGTSSIKSYLTGIAKILAWKDFNRLNQRKDRQKETSPMDKTPEEILIIKESIDLLKSKLRPREVQLLFLRTEKFPFEAIAETMGYSSADSARSMYYKVKKKAIEILKG